MRQKFVRWCRENLDIVTVVSTSSVAVVAFAITLKHFGPHISAFRQRVHHFLTDPGEKLIQFSDAIRHISTGNIQQMTYTNSSHVGPVVHMVTISDAKLQAYVVPGSEANLYNLASTHVPHFQSSPVTSAFRHAFATLVLPLVPLFAILSVLREDIDDPSQSCRQICLWRQFLPYSIQKFFSSERPSSKMISQIEEPETLEDVISAAKNELYEVVDMINDPEKFTEYGVSCPRGILLTGPPGVGKTMLARAVSQEANINFINCTASSFVEMYVGRGARKIRSLFQQARDQAPSLIFIDELDAIGSRGDPDAEHSLMWTGHDEYVQTLNQLLHEMDGFNTRNDGIIVIGATNRPRAVDPALLRCGRFDRWINMQLPNHAERYEILRVSIKRRKVKISPLGFQHLPTIAQRTSGWSGAELDSLINEAAFATYRRIRNGSITHRADRGLTMPEDLEDAMDKLVATRSNKSGMLTQQESY